MAPRGQLYEDEIDPTVCHQLARVTAAWTGWPYRHPSTRGPGGPIGLRYIPGGFPSAARRSGMQLDRFGDAIAHVDLAKRAWQMKPAPEEDRL